MKQGLKNMDKKFKTVALGGTFDHLHIGHKEFIRFALNLSEKLVIGLTSDEYVKKVSNSKYQISSIESYETRKRNLENFLTEENVVDTVSIVQINDIYGPATSEEYNFDALVVVEKTLKGAESINTKRQELGLPPLNIAIARSVNAEDGIEISSSRIRNGEIDREGKLYIKQEWLRDNLILPESLRKEFRKPFGELVTNDNPVSIETPLIAVGDITTQKFNKLSLNQKISVIDFNVNRKKRFDRISQLGFSEDIETVKVNNPAGEITPELFKAVIAAFKQRGRLIIEVSGEEDLTVLPAVLAAPLGTTIFYGQPDKGIVKVSVSEESKQKAHRLLTEFLGSS